MISSIARHVSALTLLISLGIGHGWSATTIEVHGDCNFVALHSDVVLSDAFEFADTCANPKWLIEEYTRVFGEHGVPPLMLLQEAGGRHRNLGWGFNAVSNFRDPGEDRLLSDEAIEFWRSEWPHRNAQALTNMPLWTKYAGNLFFTFWSQLLANSFDQKSLACFLSLDPLAGQGWALELPTDGTLYSIGLAQKEEICNHFHYSPKMKVGFTFITIENRWNRTIDEIEIVYRYYKETDIDQQIALIHDVTEYEDLYQKWDTPRAIDATIEAAPNGGDIHQFLRERLGDKDWIEFRSRTAEAETRKIAALAPGEKIIILLNLFYTDETLNFLPGYYIDGVVFVERLVYRAGTRTLERNVRDPFGIHAARKSLSWGWSSQ